MYIFVFFSRLFYACILSRNRVIVQQQWKKKRKNHSLEYQKRRYSWGVDSVVRFFIKNFLQFQFLINLKDFSENKHRRSNFEIKYLKAFSLTFLDLPAINDNHYHQLLIRNIPNFNMILILLELSPVFLYFDDIWISGKIFHPWRRSR